MGTAIVAVFHVDARGGLSSGVRISWSLIATLVVITASSCGPPRVRSEPGGAGVASQPASCPATFAEAPLGEKCSDTTAACTYAEGRCWCGPRSYCGGAAPPDELVAELAIPTWQCQPVRTDGCPEAQPSGACTQDGQVCSYGDCCFAELTCQGGTWVETGGGCPP